MYWKRRRARLTQSLWSVHPESGGTLWVWKPIHPGLCSTSQLVQEPWTSGHSGVGGRRGCCRTHAPACLETKRTLIHVAFYSTLLIRKLCCWVACEWVGDKTWTQMQNLSSLFHCEMKGGGVGGGGLCKTWTQIQIQKFQLGFYPLTSPLWREVGINK